MTEIALADSRITRVQVYARGALVTREAQVTEPIPTEAVTLRVGGLSPLVQAGSVRATITGGREVVALSTRLVVPTSPVDPGEAMQRIRDLDLERRALEVERAHAEWRKNLIAEREVKAAIDPKDRPHVDPAARARDALAVSGLLAEVARALETRIGELDDALERSSRDREAAQLAAAQARSAELQGRGHPTTEVVVGLAPGPQTGPITVEIAYAIGAARWWPAYGARLTDGGARSVWTLDALVAQASGEDWTDVRLSLSTADLVTDSRLPELPSLRLGRAQQAPRPGYRPPPPDLDTLFEPYDRAMAEIETPKRSREAEQGAIVAESPIVLDRATPIVPMPFASPAADFDEVTPVTAAGLPPPQAPRSAMSSEAPRAKRAVPAARPASLPRAPAPVAPAQFMPDGLLQATTSLADEPKPFAAAEPVGIEPADAWLDFDSLELAASEDTIYRGRLVRRPAPVSPAMPSAQAAVGAIEALPAPAHARDPLESRGLFDCSYAASGSCDVPSNARLHRVTLMSAAATGRTRLRTVPRETPEVFREVEVRNPFEAPLLAGPVDVFVEGALVTTSAIGAVDRGGLLLLGLGVEDRVRVARNARTEEGSAGLLGGSTAIEHAVSIDLRSSLGHAASVDVIDRIPVSDDPDVEVSLTSRPEATRYDQSDRGAPVRGGLRWRVDLPPGGQARIELQYRVKLPASSELVGGNRRE